MALFPRRQEDIDIIAYFAVALLRNGGVGLQAIRNGFHFILCKRMRKRRVVVVVDGATGVREFVAIGTHWTHNLSFEIYAKERACVNSILGNDAQSAMGLVLAHLVDLVLEPLGKKIDLFGPYNLHRLAFGPGRRGHEQIGVRPQAALFNRDQGRLARFFPKRDEKLPVDFGKGKIPKQSGIDILAIYLENLPEFVAGIADFRMARLKTHKNHYNTDLGFAEFPVFPIMAPF